MDQSPLTSPRIHALFDILTHAETYGEVQNFKYPDATSTYGHPFAHKNPDGSLAPAKHSSAPILQSLLVTFVLSLPPAKDVPPDFWSDRLQGILTKLAEADLSESYDKGAMGTRKALATAASAIIESAGRGYLGGYPGGNVEQLSTKTYDTSNGTELLRAWDEVLRSLVYGNLVDELFTYCAQDDFDSMDNHSPAVRTAVEYIMIHIGSFLHYVFNSTPDGPYLLKLIENTHKLLPYKMVRHTLRVTNAATVINGMTKLFLSKLSVGSVSNWLGITQNAEDGVNLFQRIISLVISWDIADFKKAADTVEKSKTRPSDQHLEAIRLHIKSPRERHEAARLTSIQTQQSIVMTIFQSADSKLAQSLPADQHQQCMDYYSALLSLRDREEIVRVLCRQNPDLVTQLLRELVHACEPLIRQLHDSIDLRDHISDAEAFVADFIATSKPAKSAKLGDMYSQPSVKDYVELVRRHKPSVYKWLHRVAARCPEIRDTFRAWASDAIKAFRVSEQTPGTTENIVEASENSGGVLREEIASTGQPRHTAAGAMTQPLHRLFLSLPKDTQVSLLPILDGHANYLHSLDGLSMARMEQLVAHVHGKDLSPVNSVSPTPGPGIYLHRWQSLLDETVITPKTPQGKIRLGKDVKHVVSIGKIGAGENTTQQKPSIASSISTAASSAEDLTQIITAPDAKPVVDALGKQFKAYLAESYSK